MTTVSETVSSGPFKFISQGAIVQEWLVGGKNIVLGFHDPAEYAKSNPAYFGATIGRYARSRVQTPCGYHHALHCVKIPSACQSKLLAIHYSSQAVFFFCFYILHCPACSRLWSIPNTQHHMYFKYIHTTLPSYGSLTKRWMASESR